MDALHTLYLELLATLECVPEGVSVGGGDGGALANDDGGPDGEVEVVVHVVFGVGAAVVGQHGSLGVHTAHPLAVVLHLETVGEQDSTHTEHLGAVSALVLNEVPVDNVQCLR